MGELEKLISATELGDGGREEDRDEQEEKGGDNGMFDDNIGGKRRLFSWHLSANIDIGGSMLFLSSLLL